jgi:uncharacterized HhH-GPD family protein
VAADRLYFTDDDEANALIAREPLALLIGFALDQQVSVQKAFSAPLELQKRIGGLDPKRIAAMDPDELDEAFRSKPALHRFPGTMAERTRELCATIVEDYGGKAERVWADAKDGADLRARIAALPGFGEMKIRSLGAVLAKRFEVAAARELVPSHPTLGDVDSPEALERYQAAKRAYKAAHKAKTA